MMVLAGGERISVTGLAVLTNYRSMKWQ